MGFDRNQLPDTAGYFEGRGLVLTGPSAAKWKTTRCEFHDGSDSMRVNTGNGAWVCMSCDVKGGDVLAYEMQATGAEFVDACKAVGAWVEDGRAPTTPSPKASPLSPRQALSVLGFEATLAAVAAGNVALGVELTEDDRARLLLAVNRINRITEAYP